MPKGYWIARVDVTDDEQYKAYVAANAGPFKAFGARFLVRAGRFVNPEGSWSAPVASRIRKVPAVPATSSSSSPRTRRRSTAGSLPSIRRHCSSGWRRQASIWSSSRGTTARNRPEARAAAVEHEAAPTAVDQMG